MRTPQKAKAYLPLIRDMVPRLGGYGVAAVAGEGQLRLEAYADVPALYGLFGVASLGGAVQSQLRAPPQPVGEAAPAPAG
ncbi:MAG: hypothetical protein ACYS8K_06080 [Planctomycetota bacterium]